MPCRATQLHRVLLQSLDVCFQHVKLTFRLKALSTVSSYPTATTFSKGIPDSKLPPSHTKIRQCGDFIYQHNNTHDTCANSQHRDRATRKSVIFLFFENVPVKVTSSRTLALWVAAASIFWKTIFDLAGAFVIAFIALLSPCTSADSSTVFIVGAIGLAISSSLDDGVSLTENSSPTALDDSPVFKQKRAI